MNVNVQPMNVSKALFVLEQALREEKPNDRSDIDRHYAVALTELEKLSAYINVYCGFTVESE